MPDGVLRVGIDGYNLAMPHGTGVATYGFELARALHAAGVETTGVFGLSLRPSGAAREAVFFDRLQQPHRHRGSGKIARLVRDPLRALRPVSLAPVPLTKCVDKAALADRFPNFDRLMNATNLFAMAHRHFRWTGKFVTVTMPDPPKIMHWTYPLPVRLAGAYNIYTIHDIVPLKLPYLTLDDKISYQALLRKCVDQSDHICTVSEASRADIITQFDITPSRITNTYQVGSFSDAPNAVTRTVAAATVMGMFGLQPEEYFLYYGAIEPKKNVQRLIEAYLSSGSKRPLVIVGRQWEDRNGRIAMDGMPISGDPRHATENGIIRIDYLPRRVLLQLVMGACAVTFPSLYEGFGLPVLEAMTLGTPVLSSTGSAIPEIAGEAALLVDPHSVDAIRAGLQRLDSDPALRQSLSTNGLMRAKLFDRPRYQQTLAEMYRMVTRQ